MGLIRVELYRLQIDHYKSQYKIDIEQRQNKDSIKADSKVSERQIKSSRNDKLRYGIIRNTQL